MAEFNIGKHCSYDECSRLDFLPFTCDVCANIFCKDHESPIEHKCTKLPEPVIVDVSTLEPPVKYECTFLNCRKSELVPVKCSACFEQFCLNHRSQEDHKCEAKSAKKDVKKLIVLQSFPKSSFKTYFKGAKSEKLAAKVQVMKLKQKAVGRKDIPEEHRVYFSIQYILDGGVIKTGQVFVSLHWKIGKMLDYCCDNMNIVNKNNENCDEKLKICSAKSGEVYSANEEIKNLLESEKLFNGSNIVITNVPTHVTQVEFSAE
ncbi:AN1-type zinc finger protein 1 [Ciona intestinalis]